MSHLKHAALLAFCVAAPLAAQDSPTPDPQPQVGLRLRAAGAFEGYTLFCPLRSTSTYLVDMDGEAVHEWKSDHTPGNSVYLMDDGTLLRCCREDNPVFSGGGQGGRIQLVDWDGTVLWDYLCSDEEWMQHHDIQPLPNGNVLVLAWELVPREDAIALGRDPEQTAEAGLWPDFVREIRPVPPDGAEVVWEWHAADHLIQDHDPEAAGYGDVPLRPERVDVNADHRREPPLSEEQRRREAEIAAEMAALGYTGDDEEEEGEEEGDRGRDRRPRSDWMHTNSIDYHPGLDLIVLSVPTMSEVWVLDHSTTTAEAAASEGGDFGRGGDLLYRWGNPRNYGAPGERRLFRQHDARWILGGAPAHLGITVFNNGEGRPGGPFSSVDEIRLPFDPESGFVRAPGAAFEPAEPAWSYTAPDPKTFFSSFISGAERLPNGNTLICSGSEGRIFEVTRAGEVVWDYVNPFGGEEREGRGAPEGRGEPRERRVGDLPDRPGPPAGDPPGGGPPGAGPPGGRGPGGRGGPGGMASTGLFRATRLAPDHPGLARLAK